MPESDSIRSLCGLHLAVGLSTNNTGNGSIMPAIQFDANRAMIQWAGFTFGLTQSFFDFYSSPATAYLGFTPASDTVTADRTSRLTLCSSATACPDRFGGNPPHDVSSSTPGTQVQPGGASLGYGGFQAPDLVANLRVDQAGLGEVMGAIQVNSTYYSGAAAVSSGHPDEDDVGFAIGAGLEAECADDQSG